MRGDVIGDCEATRLDEDAERLLLVAVFAVIVLGEPRLQLGLVGERREIGGDGARLLFGEVDRTPLEDSLLDVAAELRWMDATRVVVNSASRLTSRRRPADKRPPGCRRS